MALSQSLIEKFTAILKPHFDAEYYEAANPHVLQTGLDPIAHYLVAGWREGLNPSPHFDTAYYLERYPDIRGEIPFLHYVRFGMKEGRQPKSQPLAEKQSPQTPAVKRAADDEVALVRAHMDQDYYVSRHPEGAADPARHYCETGWRAGYDPHPGFSTSFYLRFHADVRNKDINPYRHYLSVGHLEQRILAGVVDAAILSRFESGSLRVCVEAAVALEPMVGLPEIRRQVVSRRNERSRLLVAARALRAEFQGRTFRVCIAVETLAPGDTGRVALALTQACSELFEPDQVLVVVTGPETGDDAPQHYEGARRLDLGAQLAHLGESERQMVLLDLLRGVDVQWLFVLDSHAIWRLLRGYGRQCAREMKIIPYMMPWNLSEKGVVSGPAIEGLSAIADDAAFILADCAFMADALRSRFGFVGARDKVAVLDTPAIPVVAQPRDPGISGNRPRVLWVGAPERRKRPDILAALARSRPGVDFIVCTPARDVSVFGPDLPANVIVGGDYDALGSHLAGGVDVLLNTSQSEGLPAAFLDAAASGVPVLAPRSGGLADLLDEDTGWPVGAADDVAAYGAALDALLADPDARLRRNTAMKIRMAERFTKDGYVARLSKVVFA